VSSETVPEFITYAKANPGKINMASSGNGSSAHVAGELFKMMTGVDMVHVPYRGNAPALTDLLGGQVQVYFVTTPASIEYIRAGTLRPLAVTTATRVDALPDVPTVSETGWPPRTMSPSKNNLAEPLTCACAPLVNPRTAPDNAIATNVDVLMGVSFQPIHLGASNLSNIIVPEVGLKGRMGQS
jgi:Tripartite tricarboxylate transporter family receptor